MKHWEARQVQNGEARPTGLDGHSPLDPAVSKTYAPDHRTHLRNTEAYITPPTRPPPGSWPTEEWLPSPPLFYDYSEEFQEQTYFRSFRTVPVAIPQTNLHQYASRNHGQACHELPGDQAQLTPVELPTETKSAPSKTQQRSSDTEYSKSSSNSESKEIAESEFTHYRNDPPSLVAVIDSPSQSLESCSLTEEAEDSLELEPSQLLDRRSTMSHQILTSHKRSKEITSRSAPMRPFSACTHPWKYLEKPGAAKGSTSSSSASMYSLDPPQQPSEPSKPTVSVSSGQPRETKTENHDAIRHESASKGITLHESNTGSPREATFIPSQDATVPIIHAPMPERSMSSPGQRQRFSQILSIEEDNKPLGPPASPTRTQVHHGNSHQTQKDLIAPSKITRYTPTLRIHRRI